MRLLTCLSVVSVLALVGCNSNTAPVCGEAVRVDLKGFAGTHKAVVQNSEFKMEEAAVTFTREAKGVYATNTEKGKTFTCQVGGRTFMESYDEEKKVYGIVLLEKLGSGFLMTLTAFDVAELTKNGIPYKLVEQKSEGSFQFLKSLIPMADDADQKYYELVVDNAKMKTPSDLGKFAHATSMSLRLF